MDKSLANTMVNSIRYNLQLFANGEISAKSALRFIDTIQGNCTGRGYIIDLENAENLIKFRNKESK